MKKKSKIIATVTMVAITFLIISTYHTEATNSPSSSQNYPVSGAVEVSKTYTPPIITKPLVDEEMLKISTQIEEIIEPQTEEISTPQSTEIIEPTNTPTIPIQAATKTNTPTPKEPPTPQMGDTHVVDGKKQSYFLGFGWIDDMVENECMD